MPKPLSSREDIAKIEIGRTDISRTWVWILATAFLATITSIPAWQGAWELRAHAQGARMDAWPQFASIVTRAAQTFRQWPEIPGTFFQRLKGLNAGLLRDIHAYEDELEEVSRLGQAVLPHMQHALVRWGGVGNENAYLGRAGWLFYRPEIDYLTGPAFLDPRQLARRAAAGSEWEAAPHPDPLKAIRLFHEQLAARGIQLVVMPAPVKPVTHPEMFSRRYPRGGPPVRNPSDAEWISRLRDIGVLVFDPAEELARLHHQTGEPQYLATDTHWRPEAMERVAEALAEFLRREAGLPEVPAAGYIRRAVEIEGRGDIAQMLKLPSGQKLFPAESVTIQEVLTPDGHLWQSDPLADVLILGDSFSNIYSLDSMGWGAAAGFVEQLSFSLQRPLDRFVRNDAGAFATRQMLSQELARGRDRLMGKRVVVWEFAARELSVGDWRPVGMSLGQPPPARFILPEPGKPERWTGTVAAIAPVPKPGSVPYKDHVVAIHLVDVETEAGTVPGAEALVYAWSMRDNVWELAARLRIGQVVDLRVQAWTDVASSVDAINRSELDDGRLMLVDPCWGEVEEQ